ncbi:Uu.00g108290.m01.CDS01 [Anthostomella pinea]|uniref:Uu.00g108290.m01.CDS01 n=1 Tax=Anthostomella pinea TaxID=933095 RepID=A0AAI8YG72_9PEZI|nr:Uu.00g108290.m01.CDS01 [Anthostomella pinea]
MSGWDLDQDDIRILDIWLSIRPQNEADIGHPSSSPTIDAAADTLLTYLASPPGAYAEEFDDFSNRFWSLINALIEFCLLHPRFMDWGITVLYRVIAKVPTDAAGELGEGPEGARLDLERFLGTYLNLYNDGTRPQVGTKPKDSPDAKDPFTVQFSAEEVEARADDVVQKMANLRKSRWKTMMVQCFAARCHVLETVAHSYKEALVRRLLEFLGIQLDVAHREWNRVDCIGLLTMLRGSSSYLLSTFPAEEREQKKQEWVKGLTSLLSTSHEGREPEDKADDIRVKSHAALALENLRAGGLNEPSADLFDVRYWMF